MQLYLQLFAVGLMSYLHYLCLLSYSEWCPTHIDYMSNMASVLLKAQGFTPGFLLVCVANLYSFRCCFFCFVCFRPVPSVPCVVSFLGLSILHCTFSFSNVYSISHSGV